VVEPIRRRRFTMAELVVAYLPEQGDLAWINFDPQFGREQAKNRPACADGLQLQCDAGLLVICPITRTERPWRTRVPLVGTATQGFIMIEQLKSLDWQVRGAGFIERVPRILLDDRHYAGAVTLN
jgi:mRNA interferase MazF